MAAAKARLRAGVRAARRARSAAQRDADGQLLARHATALVERLAGDGRLIHRVATYRATATEPPTEPLVGALRAAGVEVLVPRVEPDRQLTWDLVGDLAAAHRDPVPLDTADLVLAPGLAVDVTGMRLGQGGGYIDTAIPRLRAGVPVLVVLHDAEVQDTPLPAEAHDRRVDGALTPRGVLWFTPG